MSETSIGGSETPDPRFEFRTFGQAFDEAAQRMARLSVPIPEDLWERASEEVYVVSRANDVRNVKIRADKLDVKALVQSVDGLEQWSPTMKADFPLEVGVLRDKVFPLLAVEGPELTERWYSGDEFVSVVRTIPDLTAVRVHKRRFGYMVNRTICEVATVLINGAQVVTISSESTEIEDVKKTLRDVRLTDVENINYLQAIKRVIGMIDRPLAN